MAEVTRRQFLKRAVAGGTAIVGSVMAPGVMQKSYAQKTKLSILLQRHWVPGAAEVHQEIINEWAKKNNVEITIDMIFESRDLRSIGSAEYLLLQSCDKF